MQQDPYSPNPGQMPQYPPQYGAQQPGMPPSMQPAAQPPGAALPAGPPASQRVHEALAQIDLLAGEQVVYAFQADAFFLGSHPLVKLFAALQTFLITLTGGYIRIFLVVTNQRVMVIKATQVWCGCGRLRSVHTIALAGIKEAGSAKETQLCCVHTRTVQVQSMTQLYNLVVKKMSDQEIRSFVTNLSAVIVAHSNRASV